MSDVDVRQRIPAEPDDLVTFSCGHEGHMPYTYPWTRHEGARRWICRKCASAGIKGLMRPVAVNGGPVVAEGDGQRVPWSLYRPGDTISLEVP